jgi:purine-binding chemotaxis protein CheW
VRHVVFRLEKDRYALPLAAIREVVVPPEQFTRVPRAPRVVSGVMNLRGRVVTVVDLRALLDLEFSAADRERGDRVVILDRGRRDLGLLVSDVDGMETIEKVAAAPGRQSPAVRGVARLRGWAVTVLDPDGLDGMVVESFTPVSSSGGR